MNFNPKIYHTAEAALKELQPEEKEAIVER
jgi:hypothetical protein